MTGWTAAALAALIFTTPSHGPGAGPLPALAGASAAGAPAPFVEPLAAPATLAVCAPHPEPPEYYAFPLVTTKNVPGSALARGTGQVTFARSPFGVALAPDGSYLYDVHLSVERLKAPREGVYVAWVTTTELDRVERVGPLGDTGAATGQARWNKFLVVISLEPADDPGATRWTGPVVLRGMSRSGMMHTMAGHGPFQQENCAAYGYGG